MGSDNSKPVASGTGRLLIRKFLEMIFSCVIHLGEKFQYGPSGKQTNPGNTTNVRQPQARPQPNPHIQQPGTSTVNNNQSTAPPPYSAVDPVLSPAFNPVASNAQSAANKKAQVVAPAAKKAANPPENYCLVCRGCHKTDHCPLLADHANNPFPSGVPYHKPPAVPTKKHQVNNPFKWSSDQQTSASHPLDANMNNTQHYKMPPQTPSPTYDPLHNLYKWSPGQSTVVHPVEKKNLPVQQSKRPSPLPSPNYDPTSNPHVWVNKNSQQPTSASKKVIDLDQELPAILQRMRENKLPNFQQLNKQMHKNKPLSNVRSSLVNNKYLSDVQFVIGGSLFYGHKMILITASFLFYDHFHVKGEKQLMVDSIDLETFQKVISYCYTDQINVTEENVQELLLAATKLQVRQVTNVCHGFISNLMNHETVFIIFAKALEIDNEIFTKKCLDYINKNEEKCFSSKGFSAIPLPSLMLVLGACNYSPEKIEQITMKYTAASMQGTFEQPEQPKPVAAKTKVAQQPPKPTHQPAKPVQQQPNQAPPKKAPQTPKGAQQQQKQKGAKKTAPAQKPPGTIPNLMTMQLSGSMPYPGPSYNGPPVMIPFPYPPPQPNYQPPGNRSARTFHSSYQNIAGPLISFDDDDDRSSIISRDDDLQAKVKANVIGPRHQYHTEFSRLDFVCKRSMLLHEIWFSEDLAKSCKTVELTISVFENNQRNDVHKRTIKLNKGRAMTSSCYPFFNAFISFSGYEVALCSIPS